MLKHKCWNVGRGIEKLDQWRRKFGRPETRKLKKSLIGEMGEKEVDSEVGF